MTVARVTSTLPARVVRRTLERVERVLQPGRELDGEVDVAADAPPAPIEDVPVVAEEDSSVTRELLLATTIDEPRAARASRQARLYLERRRQKLNEALDDAG